jgi:hypothetical protein
MGRTRLWRGNDLRKYRKSESRAEKHLRQRRSHPSPKPSLPSPENLAESHPPTLQPDGTTMIPRTLSPATKRRVIPAQAVRKRDVSTSPGVGVQARTVLPRLPVPPLRSTLDKYLQSIKPLLRQDDLQGVSAFNPAYERRVQWAKEFETGIGATLQTRLVGTHLFPSTCCTHCIPPHT